MRKPSRALVLTVAVPFLSACMATVPRPLPEPAEREATDVHGVVLGDPEAGERVEFQSILNVVWTDSTLALTGSELGSGSDSGAPVVTRTYSLDDVGAILVRQVEQGRTSMLVAGTIMGAVMLGMLLFNGKVDDGSILGTGTEPGR